VIRVWHWYSSLFLHLHGLLYAHFVIPLCIFLAWSLRLCVEWHVRVLNGCSYSETVFYAQILPWPSC
jgi:hypothetical protein